MRNDAKIKRIIRRYGAEGYALYCYILESIAGNLESKSPMPALEETSEDLAYELKMDTLKVQEIVNYCIDQELLSQDELTGHILCMKMYKFLDDATRKSAEVVKLLDFYKKSIQNTEEVGQIPSRSGKVPPDRDVDGELEEDKKYTAPEDAEQVVYRTKKGRKLTGKRLDTFMMFWDSFGYKKGKAEAADAWLKIPELTGSIVKQICDAAKIENDNREELKAQGKTPKMAEGWVSGRRWEDETYQKQNNSGTPEDILKKYGMEA